MTWTRLDDGHFDRPLVLELSRDAQLVEIEALVYGNRAGTDGVIDRRALWKMSGSEDLDRAIAELVDAGLWERTGTGWQVCDWAATQLTAAQVQEKKNQHKEQQRKYRERRQRHDAGDHGTCLSWCPVKRREGSRDASRGSTTDSLPTLPDPSRPIGREGDGVGPRRADARHDPTRTNVLCWRCHSRLVTHDAIHGRVICGPCEGVYAFLPLAEQDWCSHGDPQQPDGTFGCDECDRYRRRAGLA